MQDLAVMLINLDSSSPEALEQSKRDKEIRTFLMDTAEKHPLDLILFQEGQSKKLLKDLRQDLNSFSEKCDRPFSLPAPSILGKDHIGVLVNEDKLEVLTSCNGQSVEGHRLKTLEALRKQDKNFLTEATRVMIMMVKNRSTEETLLVVSFHGMNTGTKGEQEQKKNHKGQNHKHKHIEEVLKFTVEMKKRIGSDHMLIGGDTNHLMDKFFTDCAPLCKTLQICLLEYTLPSHFHRAAGRRRMMDYFLHSSSLAPVPHHEHGMVIPFNVPEPILDHHPLLATFQSQHSLPLEAEDTSRVREALKLADRVVKEAENSLDMAEQLVIAEKDQKKPEQGRRMKPGGRSKEARGGVEKQADRGLFRKPSVSRDTGQQTARPVAGYHTQATRNKTAEFSCELCDFKSPGKDGLFKHYEAEQENHFPCRHQFEGWPSCALDGHCLRVFGSSRGLKQHRTKTQDFRQHYNTESRKTLPGLRYI